jgi:hypothetical protein
MSEAIRGGYVLIARKLQYSGLMDKPPLYSKLWLWMLLQATHSEHGTLKRGQFRCSIKNMRRAMAYKAGYRTVCPTAKEIRCSYEFFKASGMIEIKKVTHGMLVSCSSFWQDFLTPIHTSDNEDSTEKQRGVMVVESFSCVW